MAITDIIIHEMMDMGPAYFVPTDGRKKIPVPIMEFIVISSIALKLNSLFSSPIDLFPIFIIYKMFVF